MIRVNRNPSRRDLWVFALLLPAFFGLVGVLAGEKFDAPRAARGIWIAGLVLTAVYLAWPRVRRPLYVGWVLAVWPIGWTVSHLLLLVVFFGILTPVGWLMRRLGHDPLQRDFDPEKTSYWIARSGDRTAAHYFRQF